MDEFRATQVGQELVTLLGLKPINKDKNDIRYHTVWGSKTAAGLGRTIERILKEHTALVVPETTDK
jgi:hypothetical protein